MANFIKYYYKSVITPNIKNCIQLLQNCNNLKVIFYIPYYKTVITLPKPYYKCVIAK